MSSEEKLVIGFGAGLLFFAGVMLGAMCNDVYEEGQAVKHGAARYNPQTGYFQWLDEVEK